jgi:hypothetical protein
VLLSQGPTVAGIYAALPSQSDRGTAQVRGATCIRNEERSLTKSIIDQSLADSLSNRGMSGSAGVRADTLGVPGTCAAGHSVECSRQCGLPQASLSHSLSLSLSLSRSQGFFSLLTAVGNVAPVLIGGMVAAGGVGGTGLLADTPLQDAMTWVLCGAYVSSGSLFALAARDLARRDKPREEL